MKRPARSSAGFTLAELLGRRLEIRNKIASALVYPLILILMSLVSVVVIVFVLIPSISPIFVDAGLPLPGILHFFEEVQDNWLMVLLAIALGVAAGFVLWGRAKQNPGILLSADRLKCAMPVIGTIILSREAGGFARALGTLLVARVPLMSLLPSVPLKRVSFSNVPLRCR